MTYVVSAPLIAVVVSGEWRQLLAGAAVPSGVKSDDLDRLEREGYIKKTKAQDKGEAAKDEKSGAVPPAKSGPGSGKKAWQDYAETVGVNVDESADRDAIIAAVAAAGQPTE